MAYRPDPPAQTLHLISPSRRTSLEVTEALTGQIQMTRTMAGVSSIEVSVTSAQRNLLRAPELRGALWAKVAGLHWELVRISKSGDRFALTFEDAIVADLRRYTRRLSIAAGSMTRAGVVHLLAREARITANVDPSGGRIPAAIERSPQGAGGAGGQESNSWTVLGADVADPARWRRYSDGRRLIVGSDKWLLTKFPPIVFAEHTGPVGTIDFDLDAGRRAETATLEVDMDGLTLDPGMPATLPGTMGPASGAWMIEEIVQELGRTRGSIKLTRRARSIARAYRPPPKRADTGESGYTQRTTIKPAAVRAAANAKPAPNAARERMVQWALAQKGKPYVWGASGPRGFDCSGLVQQATRHAGRVLTKPSASQMATIRRRGKVISVQEAIRTRGAILYRQAGGHRGNPNHVAISLGDGRTIEAMGRAYGVCIGRANGRGWTGAGIWI